MLNKNFLPLLTSWLSGRSKHILGVYCLTSTRDGSSAYPKEVGYKDTLQKEMKEETEKIKVKTRKTKRKSLLDDKEILDIINYVHNTNPDLTDICKTQLKFYGKDVDILYFIDRDVAAKYVSLIVDDLLKNTCFVAEMNPGYGVLTTELLKSSRVNRAQMGM